MKCRVAQKIEIRSVKPLDRSHGGLDVQGLDVLPVLLQQRHEEVHGQVDVLDELLLGHSHVADSHGEAEDLLHLELDGGLQVQDLGLQVVAVGYQSGEFSCLNDEKCADQTLLVSNSDSPCSAQGPAVSGSA